MRLGFLNAAMLWGLLGVAVPLLIHLWSRRRRDVVDWGATMFLVADPGEPTRRRPRITEWLLLVARMAVLAAPALALARPFLGDDADPTGHAAVDPVERAAADRDLGRTTILVLDASSSMERRTGGTSSRERATSWARRFVRGLGPGHAVALLRAGARVEPLVDPPTTDGDRLAGVLARVGPGRGSSDLAPALAESFRILERVPGTACEVILLTDGQRLAWRPDEAPRWGLLRELHRRLQPPPRLAALDFSRDPAGSADGDEPDGALGPLVPARPLIASSQPFTLTTTLYNAGSRTLHRRVELLIDGRVAPGSVRSVGPVPPGGRAPLAFETAIALPGLHELRARIVDDDDANPSDNEVADVVAVTDRLDVLLVEGSPSLEPLRGSADFLHAALALAPDERANPGRGPGSPFRVTVVPRQQLSGAMFSRFDVAILCNPDALDDRTGRDLDRFVRSGGGLMVVLGDRSDGASLARQDWFPGRPGDLRSGASTARRDPGGRDIDAPVGRPAAATFLGPVMSRFAARTPDVPSPPLADAAVLAYRRVEPKSGPDGGPASIPARLDNGDPWLIERPHGRGRVLIVTTPLDATGGNLVVNPDFVPLIHEWVLALGGGGKPIRRLLPGEPWVIGLDPAPPASVVNLSLMTPAGSIVPLPVRRTPRGDPRGEGNPGEAVGGPAHVRFDHTGEPGVYRLALADPPGGLAAAVVPPDLGESDPARLSPAETARLASGWPLSFDTAPGLLLDRDHARPADPAGDRDSPHRLELWRGLILAALAGLCLELWLSRSLARTHEPSHGGRVSRGPSRPGSIDGEASWSPPCGHAGLSISKVDHAKMGLGVIRLRARIWLARCRIQTSPVWPLQGIRRGSGELPRPASGAAAEGES